MKLLKPENADFFNPANGNLTMQEQGVCELLKLNSFPVVIQFDSIEDVYFFVNSVIKCKP